eukprot:226955-Prorocentrum_minimum.AAC.5
MLDRCSVTLRASIEYYRKANSNLNSRYLRGLSSGVVPSTTHQTPNGNRNAVGEAPCLHPRDVASAIRPMKLRAVTSMSAYDHTGQTIGFITNNTRAPSNDGPTTMATRSFKTTAVCRQTDSKHFYFIHEEEIF